MLEYGAGMDKVISRPTSWYDNKLVTDKGETILSRYDTHGIAELRRLGLIWSSSEHSKLIHENVNTETGWGLTRVESMSPKHLRMFFLSLLWRSAASNTSNFQDISLPAKDLEYLRSLCERDDQGNENDFPTVLIVLSTKGHPHNHTPRKISYPHKENINESLNFFRFYFDGLIALIGQKPKDTDLMTQIEFNAVGFNEKCFALSVPYERSAQRDNLISNLKSALEQSRR